MKIGPFPINFRRIGTFIALLFVLALMMNLSTRLGDLKHLDNQAATVRVQATDVIITQIALQTLDAQVTSPAEVAAYARGEAHMGKPGDKVIVVLPAPGNIQVPTQTPEPAINKLTPWQVWMILIFGK